MAQRRLAYAEEPYSDAQISLYVEAWHDLQSCRSIGMDVGPVPWTAVRAWAAHHRLDREAFALVWAVVQHLEGERADQREAKRTLDSLSGNQKGGRR